MNNIKTWLSENKLAATLVAVFLALTGALVWISLTAWDSYDSSSSEYSSKANELKELCRKNPYPSPANLRLLAATIDQEKTDLDKLTSELRHFRVTGYGDLENIKPSERPQHFQDILRDEVTKIKSLAESTGSSLPSSFYLGLGEYENKPPAQEDVLGLAKQLTVLSWVAETLVSHKGMLIAEFQNIQQKQTDIKNDLRVRPALNIAAKTPTSSTAFETTAIARISFHCDQISFREVVNSLSAAPYFLLIDSLMVQNSSSEPPPRVSTPQTPESNPTGAPQRQRLPIVVGHESLNISIKLRALEFPEPDLPAKERK